MRIALAVDPTGSWHALGWGDLGQPPRTDLMEHAVETLEPGEARYWVEVEVEMPEVATVEGEVSRA